MISITGLRPYAGVSLEKAILLKKGITVLTGKNGSGKTRLLELIESSSTITDQNGSGLRAKKFLHESFIPNYGMSDGGASMNARMEQTVAAFLRNKAAFQVPLSTGGGRYLHIDGVGHDGIHDICNKIMRDSGKSYNDITEDDLRANYFEPNQKLFGEQDISLLFNSFVRRDFEARYARFTSFLDSGKDILTRQEVLSESSQERSPWEALNEVIQKVFDGKFYFAALNANLRDYNQPIRLLDRESDAEISISQLSSGEKTLMWLALTLFNSQFLKSKYLSVPSLLLLDEPDAFLHPQMVVKMYEVLDVLVQEFGVFILLTTHSPTTVALAPGDVYKFDKNQMALQDKDSAIAGLLDGVSQISISPENRRQVFVENKSDAQVYQWLFTEIANRTPLIDPKISLTFIPAGRKTPVDHLEVCIKQVFKSALPEEVAEFVALVNGAGDCGQVKVYVESLAENKTVRGIVDWDLNDGKRASGVIVSAEKYAYSIENILLDPLCLLNMLRARNHQKYSFYNLCGVDVSFEEWQSNDDLIQISVDGFIEKVLGRKSRRDESIKYLSGREVKTDKEYLLSDGHDIEELVLCAYPELCAYKKQGNLLAGVGGHMASLGVMHIPTVFAETFAKVQA